MIEQRCAAKAHPSFTVPGTCQVLQGRSYRVLKVSVSPKLTKRPEGFE